MSILNNENIANLPSLKIGWAKADITPDNAVLLQGMGHARISEGIKTPISATILALESSTENSSPLFIISADLCTIDKNLLQKTRKKISVKLPDFPVKNILISATHTHNAPYCAEYGDYSDQDTTNSMPMGLDLKEVSIMAPAEYANFAAERIAEAATEAWQKRQNAGISYGLGHAVVGRNRIVSFYDGKSIMYSNTNNENFSHVEGYEDHSLNLIATYDLNKKLSGLIINFACTAQADDSSFLICANYWHEIREKIAKRFPVHVLAQVSAAGDQSPRSSFLPEIEAEQRMKRLTDQNHRDDIARKIVDEIERILPIMEKEIDWQPVFMHKCEEVALPKLLITEEFVQQSLENSKKAAEKYELALANLQKNPQIKEQERWYVEFSRMCNATNFGKKMLERYQKQQSEENLSVELHILRLGDLAMISNPFELYLDFGMQIKAQSPATQTFVVQLAGPGSYLPTSRSLKGGAYGTSANTVEVSPEGGRELVKSSINAIENIWEETAKPLMKIPYINKEFCAIKEEDYTAKWQLAVPGGEKEIQAKATLKMLCNNEYLIMNVVAEKEKQINNAKTLSTIWDGDCLQLIIADKANKILLNLASALQKDGVKICIFEKRNDIAKEIIHKITRNEIEKTTQYNIIIPLELIASKTSYNDYFKLNMSLFNDYDGLGAMNWLSLNKGLAGKQNIKLFNKFTLNNK